MADENGDSITVLITQETETVTPRLPEVVTDVGTPSNVLLQLDELEEWREVVIVSDLDLLGGFANSEENANDRENNFSDEEPKLKVLKEERVYGKVKDQVGRLTCSMSGAPASGLSPVGSSSHQPRNKETSAAQVIPKRVRKEVVKVCDVCKKTFKNSFTLGRHQERWHPNGVIETFTCPHCNEVFHHPRNFKAHRTNKCHVHDLCEICNKRFFSPQLLDQHKAKIHGLLSVKRKFFQCQHCSFITISGKAFQIHIDRKHDGSLKYYCPIEGCNRGFTNESSQKSHVLTWHTSSTEIPCKLCDKTFKSSSGLEKHISVHHTAAESKVWFCCEFCTFRSLIKFSLQSHLWSKHKFHDENTTFFVCELCGYKDVKKSSLKRHLESHEKIDTYVCPLCGEDLLSSEQLDEHMKTVHDNELPFKCQTCLKSFQRNEYLMNHIQIKHSHVGLKPYQCPHCTYTGALKRYIVHHIRRNHKNEERYVLQLYDLEDVTQEDKMEVLEVVTEETVREDNEIYLKDGLNEFLDIYI